MTMSGADALPAVLTTRHARELGVRHLLRNGTYERVGQGLHLVVTADPADPDVRIALASAGLPPGVVLGGWAAARLHERARLGGRAGPPQFDGVARVTGDVLPVLLLAGRETRLSPKPWRNLVRSVVPAGERVARGPHLVTSPVRTAFDLARLGPVPDAVVALDRLRTLRLVTVEALGAMIGARAGWRGAHQARRVLAFSTDRSESPQESALRVLWCESGLPRPVPNATVLDGLGRFVARVDLLDPDAGLVGEYDGAVHASSGRRSADSARQERLEQLGLTVVRATAVDVLSESGRTAWKARLRQAHVRARSRTSADRRWRLARAGDVA